MATTDRLPPPLTGGHNLKSVPQSVPDDMGFQGHFLAPPTAPLPLEVGQGSGVSDGVQLAFGIDWLDITVHPQKLLEYMGSEVATYCIGQAASGAAIVLMAGSKGKRFILPNAKVMLHQPYGGITGQAEDIRIQADEVLRDKVRLNEIIAKCTGKPVEQVTEETERDRFLNAEEALAYGLVDEILDNTGPKKKDGKDK